MGIKMIGLDVFEKELMELGEAEDIAKQAIDAATPILVDSLKSEIEKVANKGYATGTLKNSIKATKAAVNKQGCFAAVRPTGVDEKGIRNGEKFGYLENGTSKQIAKPVLRKAIEKSEKACLEAMQKKYDEVTK